MANNRRDRHSTLAGEVDTVEAMAEIVGKGDLRGGGCDICIDMVGHGGEAAATAATVVKRDGIVLIFGLPPHENSRFTGSSGKIGAGGAGGTDKDVTITYSHLTKNLTYLTSHISENDSPMPLFLLGTFLSIHSTSNCVHCCCCGCLNTQH